MLPARDPDAPVAVHISLNSSALIDIAGSADTRAPYLEGPHSAEVHENDGEFEVEGRLGDDGLLVVPADVDLALEANGVALRLSGIRGSLVGQFNVGHADISAAFVRGQSRIEANVGILRITLDPESNVVVELSSATSIRVSDDLLKTGRGTWTYGSGDAGLEISGNIGRLIVDVDDAADTDVEVRDESPDAELTDVGVR